MGWENQSMFKGVKYGMIWESNYSETAMLPMWQTLHVSPPMTHKCYMGAHHMKWCLETGNTPNISEYAKFVWYEPIYYYENVPFPQTKRQIACWLRVMYWIGEALCYWILINTGQLIAWSTIEKLSHDECLSPLSQIEITHLIPRYNKNWVMA